MDYFTESKSLIDTVLKNIISCASAGWESIDVEIDYSVPGKFSQKIFEKVGTETKPLSVPGITLELAKIIILHSRSGKDPLKYLRATITADKKFKINYEY